MSNSNSIDEVLQVIGQVLIRCFVIGIAVLLLWLCALSFAGDLGASIAGRIVPISREQFYALNLNNFIIVRSAIFVLFLFPYIAIRLVINRRAKEKG
jgi:hypothetical protein